MRKIKAQYIKTAVLTYYRYKRHMPCVDEAWCGVYSETSDVLVVANGKCVEKTPKALHKNPIPDRFHKAFLNRLSSAYVTNRQRTLIKGAKNKCDSLVDNPTYYMI